MSLFLAGLSHHTAAVEVRECLAVVDRSPEETLARLLDLPKVKEGFFVSTCNRVEFLLVTDKETEKDRVAEEFVSLIAGMSDLNRLDFRDSLYLKKDREAVQHLFRVASSLDSMVVGEPQILGQIKQAYHRAASAGSMGVILNRLMHRAFHVAKRVRTETGISDRAVSIAFCRGGPGQEDLRPAGGQEGPPPGRWGDGRAGRRAPPGQPGGLPDRGQPDP